MNNFKTALENVMQKDIERFENGAEHEFSAEFEKNMAELSKRVSGSKRPKRMRIGRVIAAVAAAVALFATGTLAGAVSSGFDITRSMRLGLPTKLFTVSDTEGCPTTIETVYMIDGFPSNQISISDSKDGTVSAMYFPAPWKLDSNGEMRMSWDDELYLVKVIHLWQQTKETFKFEYTDMDYVTCKTLTVNGGQAYFITRERFYGMESYLFWESEDYIFTLRGSFSEERALELAGSLVVYDGELPFYGVREV